MGKLVYYIVPTQYSSNSDSFLPLEETFNIEFIVRNSKENYKKFFSEEFTDKLMELSNFLFMFLNVDSCVTIYYKNNYQNESVQIKNKMELIDVLEHLNFNRTSYKLVYKNSEGPYLVAYSDNSGVLYLYTNQDYLQEIEEILKHIAQKSSFEEYELDN